jgi:hypothetical protein
MTRYGLRLALAVLPDRANTQSTKKSKRNISVLESSKIAVHFKPSKEDNYLCGRFCSVVFYNPVIPPDDQLIFFMFKLTANSNLVYQRATDNWT